ncbi:transcription repressor OFP13-like [Solanum pennellii]|uniref:Transcription repressor n=1 Tax=Solanum pennellii TaxID=28526 RepID=A0ABM1FJI1_SOLPN|nr:transcription repressor OFP13-like [Solanum pennellii]
MGKKMNLGSWQWPSCTHSKTQSFRANHIFKTINSIFLDPSNTDHHHGVVEIETTPESWFTNSSESASFSTESEETGEPLMELIIKGVRSERLFFEPNCTSSSILQHQDQNQNQNQSQSQEKLKEIEQDVDEELPFKESVALALESEDPYLDFKKSMEEMVDTHEIKDWESLQELLQWYLKMNGKINHGFIIGAFVDLLIGFTPSNCDSITCYSSAASSFSAPSSPLSSIEEKGE